MKKILIVMAVIALSANSLCYAEKNWFDVELAKIRNVKDAKCKLIDKEIADITTVTTRLQTDTSVSSAERQQQIAALNRRTSELNSQKTSIERQYKADKETLKNRWKSGNRNSNDIVSRWVNDDSIGNIIPKETYTYTQRTMQTPPVREVTNQTTRYYGEQPVSKVTTTTVTTTTKQPVQRMEYKPSYNQAPPAKESGGSFVMPTDKTVDPSNFRVILN